MKKRTLLSLLGVGLIYAGCGGGEPSPDSPYGKPDALQPDAAVAYDTEKDAGVDAPLKVDAALDALKEVYLGEVGEAGVEVTAEAEVGEDGGAETDAYQIFLCPDLDKDGFFGTMVGEECYAPSGKDGDCDDNDESIYPGAPETCNVKDDNCDLKIDEDLVKVCTTICGTGIETCIEGTYSGCTATNPTVEFCDGLDNNCNSFVDEGQVMNAFYFDADGDGFGDLSQSIVGCTAADGSVYSNGVKVLNYVNKEGDCDDANATIYPGAIESCNGVDDNCNGIFDEGAAAPNTFYLDEDNDGYGSNTKTEACVAPAGYVNNNLDCNDTNAAVNPAAKEACNAIDDNCNDKPDDGLEQVIKCGYNNNGTKTTHCVDGAITDKTICDDPDKCKLGEVKECGLNPALPGAKCELDAATGTYMFKATGSETSTAMPDGLDNNCDGKVDEAFFVFVPAGEYQVGCNYPAECSYAGNQTHSVETPGFYISKFEFTQKQAGTSGNLPEIDVTKAEAELYCTSLGGRLPTADEWEIAAKSGKVENIYPWGTLEPSCNLTNYWFCTESAKDVGSYPLDKSGVGAYDMGGNVSELTSTPDGVFTIAKGGNFQDEAKYVLVYQEQPKDPAKGDAKTGFRCVLDEIN